MFSWTAELLRTDSEGKQSTTQFSLSTLADGKGPNVPVQSGDVIVVEKSALGAVPALRTVPTLRHRSGFSDSVAPLKNRSEAPSKTFTPLPHLFVLQYRLVNTIGSSS